MTLQHVIEGSSWFLFSIERVECMSTSRFLFLHLLQVQAVLLLLGGRELPQALPTGHGSSHQNNRVLVIKDLISFMHGTEVTCCVAD